MTDWEIWACAAKLRADHGELEGFIQAEKRADALLKAGDVKGHGNWIEIKNCIANIGALFEARRTRH